MPRFSYEELYNVWNICAIQLSITHSRLFNYSNGLKFTALHFYCKICRILKIYPTFRQLLLIRGGQ